jgi:branched-subunit amino acid transport protein
MLKQVSRFVLEVLPYVLSALIAAIVLPGFLMSQLHGKPATVSNWAGGTSPVLEIVHYEHTPQTLSPQSTRAVDPLVAK